ncbi:MAG: DUF1570 domain-containing protein [Planctomycetes bacterium]|nr:DUF1570 domain-containing protein [Planctomycetota bacterium]
MPLLALALAALAFPGDAVTLKNGKSVEGRVIRDTAREVVVRVGSQDKRFGADEVLLVSSQARKLEELLAQWDACTPGEVGAVRNLARECRARGLDGEARVFALLGLTLDAADGELHELAGHEKRGEGWRVRVGSKREDFDKRAARALDWGAAWEFETTHFAVKSNLALRDAVGCAIELELVYRAFFAWFEDELPLHEPGAGITAHVHADSASFPEASGRLAYFDPRANVLHVNASQRLDIGALVHESVHALLHNTSSNTKAALGAVPAWLDEGLAEYLPSCRYGELARGVFTPGQRNEAHFARHRSAEKPYDLGRVLTFDSGDFAGSSQSDLKYSQAYTLTHFCLHGGAEQRAQFFDFFRRAYAGHGSSTDFKNALGLNERKFEAAWREYVLRSK